MNSFLLPAALLVLGCASLMVMQPVFSLFGQAYGVAVSANVVSDEATAAETPQRMTVEARETEMPRPFATATAASQLNPTAPATARVEVTRASASPSPSFTPRPAASTATHTATSRPSTAASSKSTVTATLTASPTATATPSSTATACPYGNAVLALEPAEQRIALNDDRAKASIIILNAGEAAIDGISVRLTLVQAPVSVKEVRLGPDLLSQSAKAAAEYGLPPLMGGAEHELTVVFGVSPATPRMAGAPEAEVLVEVLTPSCTAHEPELRAKGSIVLTQPAKTPIVTPSAVVSRDTVETAPVNRMELQETAADR
jgi:hypothetical protein